MEQHAESDVGELPPKAVLGFWGLVPDTGSDWLDQVQVLQVQQALMFLEKLSDFLQTLLPVLNFCVLT